MKDMKVNIHEDEDEVSLAQIKGIRQPIVSESAAGVSFPFKVL